MEKTIMIYNTHIEISPYTLGDIPELEKRWSIWDTTTRRYVPLAYYIDCNTMFIPKGSNLFALSKLIKTQPVNVPNGNNYALMKYNYLMKMMARDNEQIQSINFLLCQNQFQRNKNRTQLSLNLPTEYGKTYCAINAMCSLGVRCIIITHKKTIRDQWISEILKFTTVDNTRIKNILTVEDIDKFYENSDIDYDIFVVTHSLITTYANKYSWDRISVVFENIGVGLKIIDEVHLRFKNTLMIDFFTNVTKNFYLTATHGRSDNKEMQIFNKAFSSSVRFGDNLNINKHTIYVFRFFNSYPTSKDRISILTTKGVSAYLYADYSFKNDPYKTLELMILKTLEECVVIEGRILILVPKIENTEYLLNVIKKKYPDISSGAINSKRNKDEIKNTKENDRIIVSTIKSLGTGDNILKLRNLILTEPFSSNITADQVIGRLRKYSETEYTYVHELINTGFPDIMRQVEKRFKVIKKKCLSIKQIKM